MRTVQMMEERGYTPLTVLKTMIAQKTSADKLTECLMRISQHFPSDSKDLEIARKNINHEVKCATEELAKACNWFAQTTH